ncbi:MAG: hypothetical protein LBI27_03420, partial [Clostridiales bacterium]|nr:hypothetical protein [Clostridiales bacterium]
MDNYSSEKTSFETNPIESPADAVRAFAEAFDALQTVLHEFEFSEFSDALRTAMYRPVRPCEYDVPPISLYEIGVVYIPDLEITGKGKYGINNKKLNTALA